MPRRRAARRSPTRWASSTKVLTTEDLADLNRKVDAERQKPEDVAADYLKSKNLL